MVDLTEFESISPYTDAEAAEALSKLAEYPVVNQASQYFFPDEAPDFLKNLLKSIKTIDDFQILVMQKFVRWVLQHTAHNFSYDGVSNIDPQKKFLALSNHRDIILDPAITQLILYTNGIPMTEIAVGDNLITNQTIEWLIRSNRMIKVIRGVSSRELYLSSQLLSKCIRLNITEGRSSIWLAQRQGRTKNGYDITEQGLLKMLDMSGASDFQQNFEELNIIPMSISYEYEPCDFQKAIEIAVSKLGGTYQKAEGEDIRSILYGIRMPKGDVHIAICEPITREELEECGKLPKAEAYKMLKDIVDKRIYANYKLHDTNYIAHDMLHREKRYADRYTKEGVRAFKMRMAMADARFSEAGVDLKVARKVFLEIYANPVDTKIE